MGPGSAAWTGSLALALLLGQTPPASAQTGENVAVVINESSPDSVRIGEYYARARKVPAPNVIRIRASTEERIDRADYATTIERPIARALSRAGLQDRVLYVVLTKGVPLRINGTSGRQATGGSVDSELTLLYRRMTGRQAPVAGPVANPYFLADRPIEGAAPFTHRAYDIFLVTRLDGFTVEDALELVDRGQAPAADGSIVLNQRGDGASHVTDRWIAETAARLRAMSAGHTVLPAGAKEPRTGIEGVLGFYSWGSNDRQGRARRTGMAFVPGALAVTFTSSDARTFQPPPDDWVPADNAAPPTAWFAGSPQSLAGDLIRDGVTGLAGNVTEPYLAGAVHPEVLFPAYLSGFNLAEAFYLSLPHLGWQSVVIGDPLCAPFRQKVLTTGDIEDPQDEETELPAVFSRWQLEVARATQDEPLSPQALKRLLRVNARLVREDREGARHALEELTALAPAAAAPQLHLASLYEEAGQYDAAIARYRQVVALQPGNVVALNNLAYNLAVHHKAIDEALPLARRAAALAPRSIRIIDTVAWIEHLRGNSREAARLLAPLLKDETAGAEIHLHGAAVHAALGEHAVAVAHLKEALRLDAALESRDEVKALRQQLGLKRP